MWRVGIWAENLRCTGILVLQWQGENFWPSTKCEISYFQPVHSPSKNAVTPKVINRFSTKCEISHFQPVHCPGKNAVTPKVINRFSKTFLHVTDVEGGYLGQKFEVHRYFSFAMAR